MGREFPKPSAAEWERGLATWRAILRQARGWPADAFN